MRINYINSLRLIATLAVVFLHTSAGILDTREISNPTDKFMLACFKYSMQFAVPIFVMISGALFLNPAKEAGFSLMLRKYVKRIALALLVFGLPMCLVETYFSNSGGGINKYYEFSNRSFMGAHVVFVHGDWAISDNACHQTFRGSGHG